MDDVELYFCYSVVLRDYLYKHGVKYRICAIHPNSQKMFWLYIKTDKLDKLLSEYSEQRATER